MKKAFDQTVRDLKRGVNKKVLKIPGIEQKILDATSNEPWGPHGSHLADIAQATQNFHEYQIIMHVIWKRINDTGKNWRHVYKALIVLEYLVANGSEPVIDEMREHSYQISTLFDFQYIDSSGRDQGRNVRRKSQSLVALVNDKERIQEVRLKALANRDKYCSTFSTGGTYRPSSYSSTGGYGERYDDDRYDVRYGSKDEERNGYGRERQSAYRDGDRYSRSGDSYSREGDRYGRNFDDRYGRESHRDDDYRGSRSNEDYQYGSRNRSFDRDRDHSFDDDDCYSSRSGGGRADDPSQDDRLFKRKLSEQNVSAPPSYEEVTRDAQTHMQEEKNGGNIAEAALKASPPSVPKASSPRENTGQISDNAVPGLPVSTESKDVDGFDDFDPRGSVLAALPAASSLEVDLFGSLSTSDPINPLAVVPVTSATITPEAVFSANLGSGTDFVSLSSASHVLSQPSEDPFGEPPFKATQENFPAQQQNFAPVNSVQLPSNSTGAAEPSMPLATNMETAASLDFGDSFGGITYTPSVASGQQPPFASPATLAPAMPAGTNVTGMLAPQAGAAVSIPLQATEPTAPTNIQTIHSNLLPQLMQAAPPASQAAPFTAQAAQPSAPTNMPAGPHMNLLSQSGLSGPTYPLGAAPTSALPPVKIQPSKEKFETKSTVWADTLSRGLVNLNISGPKINPHADIGIDFDSINRKEKRKEEKRSSAATATSTVTMGKAMGAGSGIGWAGASGRAPPPNPMMGSGMGMGMGIGMGGGGGVATGMGMGIGGYGGGMNQLMGMGMGVGMNMGMVMGMGMPTQLPTGMATSGPGMPGVGYNPMMGMDRYGSQQPYGGYR